jgi:predicted aspartyl protease
MKPLVLTYKYTGLVKCISTPVELFFGLYDARKSVVTGAIWDTGATRSVIAPEIAQKLNLNVIDTEHFYAVSSKHLAEIAFISILFPNKAVINDIRVAICPITPKTNMLIGMDIISQIDFAVTNGGGQTQFTFAIPPFKNKIDFEKRLDE